MLLTIFTPTYNRVHTLPRLYKSLCRQTDKNFEWLVIDDGSSDETPKLFSSWLEDNYITMRYITKENGGKPSAYNVATKEARGDLFLCVDSDDYLTDDAVENVLKNWEADQRLNYEASTNYDGNGNRLIIGSVYFKGYHSLSTPPKVLENSITKYSGSTEFATLLDFYRLHGLQGDTMLVYRTNVVRKYLFPRYEGEKFVPEAFIYDQYDNEGVLHIHNDILYLAEYLPDGYTFSMRKINHDNPKGYEAFIRQRLLKDTSLYFKLLDTIRYVAIKFVLDDGRMFIDCQNVMLTLLSFFPGWLFYKKVYSK